MSDSVAACGCPVEEKMIRIEYHTRECRDREGLEQMSQHMMEMYGEENDDEQPDLES